MTIVNMQQASHQKQLTEHAATGLQSLASAITHPNPTTQLLLTTKITPHRPEVGVNPLVDAAAYLFSMLGKLKHLKSYGNLSELHAELVKQIKQYQEAVCTYSYNHECISEYIPITTYALCATLDDVIASTPWGGRHRWDEYSLVVTFNQESLSQKSFFIILERLVRDPAIYIDVMEFMYICLSLGFRCHYSAGLSEFDHDQIEQITNALYKRIRAYRGNFSKALSPFPIKPPQATGLSSWNTLPVWLGILIVSVLLGLFFTGGKYWLDHTFNQAYQNLTRTENSGHYELHP